MLETKSNVGSSVDFRVLKIERAKNILVIVNKSPLNRNLMSVRCLLTGRHKLYLTGESPLLNVSIHSPAKKQNSEINVVKDKS